MVSAVALAGGLACAGCGASKARLPPAPIDSSPRLAEADALVEAGCFDCLRDALQEYQVLRTMTAAPPPALARATAGAFRAAALLALRQRELGMIDDGYLNTAKELRTAWSCGDSAPSCESLDRLLDIIGVLPFDPLGRRPASDAQLADAQRLNRNRQEWTSALRGAAGTDLLSAYTWLAFACGPSGAATRDDAVAALGALRDVPLLVFKRATCSAGEPDTLQALLSGNSRFIEISYPLGLLAISRSKFDQADESLEQGYAWHPRWPAVTLTLGNVAMTGEDFERALTFYDKTLDLEGDAVQALLGKARALTYLGRYEQSIAVVDQLLAERWYVGDARYWRAMNEFQLGRLDEAWSDIEEAARLLFNALVPKLAGLISYRRQQLDVARAQFGQSRERDPDDCETGFYLGVVLAEQRAWDRTATVFIETTRCLETAERDLNRQIERIRASSDSPERQARQIARRERQLAEGRRMLAQSRFNTAVAYYTLSRYADARPFAEKVADDEQFGERAREIISRLK
jgi:tetratricopeptide (TPR) repeat protein